MLSSYDDTLVGSSMSTGHSAKQVASDSEKAHLYQCFNSEQEYIFTVY